MSTEKKPYLEQDQRIQEILGLGNELLTESCAVCGSKLRFEIQTNVTAYILSEAAFCPGCQFQVKPRLHRIH